MKRKITIVLIILAMAFTFAACGEEEKTEVNVFAAASLNGVMTEFEKAFEAANPGIDIIINADSSGTLLAQIEEGAPCDIFFSAAQKQMDQLSEDGLIVDGTRTDVVNNQLAVITWKGSSTKVTGIADIGDAESLALADGSVPVGKYTRQAMMNIGLIEKTEDPSAVKAEEVSRQLGGIEISEQSNVSKVLSAVEEASSEVGTVYLSDIIGHEDKVTVLEAVPYGVTGNIIYPVCQVVNNESTDEIKEAAAAFLMYITGDDAEEVYRKYGFDTDI